MPENNSIESLNPTKINKISDIIIFHLYSQYVHATLGSKVYDKLSREAPGCYDDFDLRSSELRRPSGGTCPLSETVVDGCRWREFHIIGSITWGV